MKKAPLHNYGIRAKFSIIMSVGSLLTLLMVTSTITLYEHYSFKTNLSEDLNIQADIVGQHLGVALSSHDSISASESLRAFNTNPNIPLALVIDLNGSTFAAYTRSGVDPPQYFAEIPQTRFVQGALVVVKNIFSADSHVGFLYLKHEVPPLSSRLLQYLPLIIATFLALALMNTIVASGTSIFIIRPMQQLTKTANDISTTHDYSLRTNLTAQDEIGRLAKTFDELVSTAEANQNSLIQNNEQLSKQTIELHQQRIESEKAMIQYQVLALDHEHLLNSANEGIVTIDPDGLIIYTNPKAASLLALDVNSLLGSQIADFFYQKDSGANDSAGSSAWMRSKIGAALLEGQSCKVEDEKWITNEKQVFFVGYNFFPVLDHQKEGDNGVIMFEDITSRKDVEQKLSDLANFDSLTNLPNRRYFSDSLEKAITRAARNNSMLALLYIDIDHFKFINDNFGHDAGDRVLQKVAEGLTSCVRSSDLTCRLAGDEFAVVLFDVGSPSHAQTVSEKIVQKLSEPHLINGQEVIASPSIGIAMYPGVGDDYMDLLRAGDAAMYQVKKKGRQGVQFFEAELQQQVEARNTLVQALNKSTYNDDFSIVYQPKFSLTECRMIGMEALLRWRCNGEPVSPEVFIPLAEESGAICPIGEWVLQNVCLQLSSWQKTIPECKNLRVAVNVSPTQLRVGGFDKIIKSALDDTGLSPECLEIEITETAVMEDPEAVISQLERIKELGVHISIDDFGTGYSSLNYLKRLPIDELKIDKSFTMDLFHDEGDETIVRAIIDMAHSLDVSVMAEGVETFDQLVFLDQNQCDHIQGYHFCEPLSAETFEHYFDDESWQCKPIFSHLISQRMH